ncbi:Putative zinc-or iron-chelating domain-containing protein [Salegentibacter holothuriorum]|uniref:Putative zinc-or iron-chelating domain-containing protein n=1 Tax=Salegentibacter holothuriorum TaxID=241145 RepID=A0A1T5D9I3_9FLAO|nr:YkgJ family cysteine cluster protein [Salegentibacter holothuriorum]SKB68438.1 Putative zinc-or iron-chelating domain-containing protein [Salegentibacter holothuriorum]
MSEPTNICLACGLCCDGTLIGFVQLDREELAPVKKLMDIEQTGENGMFFLPCNELGCNGCNIYSQRPKQCSKFECGVLKSFEKKELSFDKATEVIDVVKQKKIAIEKHVATLQIELQSKSFHFKMLELKKLLRKDKSELSLSKNHQELKLELEELEKLLSKSFGVSF